jgi:hypothetical protein
MTFIVEYISNYCECGGGFERYFVKGPSSDNYLKFSREELNDDNLTRSWVNSVGNSKRALHLQVEMICKVFGWDSLYTKKIIGFPKRLNFLEKCGIINPRILAKINKNRNKIEHDYYFPSSDEAQDYADIVELFISATDKYIERFPSTIDFELMDDDNSLGLPKLIEVEIAIETGGINIISDDKTLKNIDIKDKEYFMWLSAVINQYQL